MTKSAHAFFHRADAAPFGGSVAYSNAHLLNALATLGYQVRRSRAPEASRLEQFLPLPALKERAALQRSSPADLALYDDAGLSLCPPSHHWARRNVVLYHGLLWNPGTWLGQPEIDLHCGNSPYLERVLRSFSWFPDWERRECLDPRAQAVSHVRLPLPSVEAREGFDGAGAELPAEVEGLLDAGAVLGHAVQQDKLDFTAALLILFHLNELTRESGHPPVRLVVPRADLTDRRRAAIDAALEPMGSRTEDLFIGVPALSQPALFRLMRASAFGLAYNDVPESFGFYVLESVHQGCPVFTNGAGNLRFGLPPEHGLTVHESLGIADQEPGAFAPVAEQIHHALQHRAEARARCQRGAALLDANHSAAALTGDLAAALKRIESSHDERVTLDQLKLELGPLVRSLHPVERRALTDLGPLVLSPEETRVMEALIGAPADAIRPGDAALRWLPSLFERGLLCLAR